MSLARVELQSAPRYPLGQMLRVLGGHQDIVLSVIEAYVYSNDPVETKRPRSHEAQVIVYPTQGTLAHGLLGRSKEECLGVRPLEHQPIDFGKFLRNLRDVSPGVFAYLPGGFVE